MIEYDFHIDNWVKINVRIEPRETEEDNLSAAKIKIICTNVCDPEILNKAIVVKK